MENMAPTLISMISIGVPGQSSIRDRYLEGKLVEHFMTIKISTTLGRLTQQPGMCTQIFLELGIVVLVVTSYILTLIFIQLWKMQSTTKMLGVIAVRHKLMLASLGIVVKVDTAMDTNQIHCLKPVILKTTDSRYSLITHM
jgi:hypothetical protein